jgi:hypothetical protein
MDALSRLARISKLDRKTNEYIRRKMDGQDTILNDITRKQLIWYGPNSIAKNCNQLEPRRSEKQGRRRRTWKDGIYRLSHELRSLFLEGVPYVKIYRYNPKHLYQKFNGYGDNGN